MFEKLKKLDRILSTSTEDRRRKAREDLVDGVATISSQQNPLKNWSASGFCVGPCMIAPKPGDRLDVTFSIPLANRKLEFSCRIGVMRYDKVQREFGGVFFNLDESIQDLIDEHFEVFSTRRYGKDLLESIKSTLRRE